jgi:hypothetical protein
MQTALLIVIIIFIGALRGGDLFHQHVSWRKVRWYDFVVVAVLFLSLQAVSFLMNSLGSLSAIAFFILAGLYTVDVIDARPERKSSKK